MELNSFSEISESDKSVLVMFWGSWCPVCKRAQPMLKELSEEISSVKIVTVNVDKNPQLSVRYNVNGTPTFILFKDGKEKSRTFGSQSKNQLKKFVESD